MNQPAKILQGSFPGGKPHQSVLIQQKTSALINGNNKSLNNAGIIQRNSNTNSNIYQLDTARLNLKDSGSPLPQSIRSKMESVFNTDFSNVRIHTGPQAESIGALAFATGNDIYFGNGQYNPGTSYGQRILGHELTHIVQQRLGRVKNPFGRGVAVVQDPGLEAEAERMGLKAASFSSTVQRKINPSFGSGNHKINPKQKSNENDVAQPTFGWRIAGGILGGVAAGFATGGLGWATTGLLVGQHVFNAASDWYYGNQQAPVHVPVPIHVVPPLNINTIRNILLELCPAIRHAVETGAQYEVWLQVELAKALRNRGYNAAREVTYGDRRSLDILVGYNDTRAAIELKTESATNSGNAFLDLMRGDFMKIQDFRNVNHRWVIGTAYSATAKGTLRYWPGVVTQERDAIMIAIADM